MKKFRLEKKLGTILTLKKEGGKNGRLIKGRSKAKGKSKYSWFDREVKRSGSGSATDLCTYTHTLVRNAFASKRAKRKSREMKTKHGGDLKSVQKHIVPK